MIWTSTWREAPRGPLPVFGNIDMDRIRLVGGNELRGEIPISGAKNAALPLMIASILTREPLVLENVPRLADVKQLERILENHGVDIAVHGRTPRRRRHRRPAHDLPRRRHRRHHRAL